MANQDAAPIINLVQNDTGREIEYNILDFDIPVGATSKLWLIKPSKKISSCDGVISENMVTVALTDQVVAEKGMCVAQLKITKDGKTLSSFTMYFNFEEDTSTNGIISQEDIKLVETFIQEQKKKLDAYIAEKTKDVEKLKTDVGNLDASKADKTETAKLKEDIDSLELRSCGNAKEEGFTICDKDENIGVQIGSKKIWDNLPYNRKYGWGGIPYGNGELPPYSRIVGMFEADMFSVRGGKGRWNGDDTNNFKHGGHLFEGWNKEEDVRLTFGIGLKNKDISWIQTFHPATEEGTDGGAYYGVTKIGSDIDREGVDFMPTVAKSQSIICLKVGNDLVPKREHVQELVDTGELVDWEYSSSDMIPFGAMYFDYNMNKVRVYTKTGWKSLKFEEDI